MEDTKTSIVIAVVPGTRSLGVAVFKGLELTYYGVKEASKHRLKHTPHSRSREAVRTVEQVIHKYQPGHFVTLSPHSFQRLSTKLPTITKEVARAARRFRLTLHEYQRAEIRKQLCPSGKATRQAVAAHLSLLYPELARYMKGVSLWQRLYYARMFDAVAVGYAHATELQRERERIQLARQDERALTSNANVYETIARAKTSHHYPRPLPGTYARTAARG
jgi:Holliday junction resolvasome RuvABC endonuclease subunit